MSHVLVTGGHGFIGSHLVERLAADGHHVTVFDPAAPPPDLQVDRMQVRHVAGDVRDAAAVRDAICGSPAGTGPVDTVYHLSAVVGVDRYLSRPLDVLEINILGTRAVLAAAAEAGARVVVASTSEVFGRNPGVPWDEDADRVLGSTATDRWSYATSKAAAEHLTFGYVHQHGLAASIVRYFNVYGPRQRPAYLVSRSVHRLLRGLPPLVYDTGRQTRCLTYVADAVDATVRAAGEVAVGRAYNIGSETPTTIADVVEIVTAAAGSGLPAARLDTRVAIGGAYEDIVRRVPDAGRAGRELGWRAATTPADGIAATVSWARSNRWWLDPAVESGATAATRTAA